MRYGINAAGIGPYSEPARLGPPPVPDHGGAG